jgi:hypothetical protein
MHVNDAKRVEKNCCFVENANMHYIVTENANVWIGNNTKPNADHADMQEMLQKILCILQLKQGT